MPQVACPPLPCPLLLLFALPSPYQPYTIVASSSNSAIKFEDAVAEVRRWCSVGTALVRCWLFPIAFVKEIVSSRCEKAVRHYAPAVYAAAAAEFCNQTPTFLWLL